jgi:hypothetical protein
MKHMIDEKRNSGQERKDLFVINMPTMKEKTEKIGIHFAEILVEGRVFILESCFFFLLR